MRHYLILILLLVSNNILGQQQNDSKATGEKIFKPANKAEFPGGEPELFKFISTNIKYPAEARRAGISGTVLVSFIVESDGSINQGSIKIEQSVHPSLDSEVIRLVGLMPIWTPGNQRGKNLRSKAQFPVTFKI